VPTNAFSFKNVTLHYIKSGSGPKSILLFHGFGQDHRVFDDLTNALANEYTIYSFDLFFHGESSWGKDEDPMEKEFWKELMAQFLTENSISKFNVLGFSMGGKFALACVELFPDLVEEIFLLAPDGIKTSFWYSLATYPHVFRKLFKSMISHHQRFTAVARAALRLRLIDKGVLRFVELQMNTEGKRKRVYYSWVVFRHLQFDLDKIASILNDRHIPLTLIIGRYDKIITAKNMQPFLDKLRIKRFETIEAGHNDLISKSLRVIVKS
jgi:pimeloyl-ACP methyl ester carboxylesterase